MQYFCFSQQNSVHRVRNVFLSGFPRRRTQTSTILKMLRIRYNFYAKFSKSRGLNFQCTNKFCVEYCSVHFLRNSTQIWFPATNPKPTEFFHVPNLHTSATSIHSNFHAQEKQRPLRAIIDTTGIIVDTSTCLSVALSLRNRGSPVAFYISRTW